MARSYASGRRILREMAAEKNLRFRRQQLGRVLEVVTLEPELQRPADRQQRLER